jgi:hypothetical protein
MTDMNDAEQIRMNGAWNPEKIQLDDGRTQVLESI